MEKLPFRGFFGDAVSLGHEKSLATSNKLCAISNSLRSEELPPIHPAMFCIREMDR